LNEDNGAVALAMTRILFAVVGVSISWLGATTGDVAADRALVFAVFGTCFIDVFLFR